MCLPYHLCPGLPYHPGRCSFARVSAYIPAIYLHSGRVAWLPVAGLMMTGPVDDDENRALFLLPNIWSSSPLARCLLRFLRRGRYASGPFLYGVPFRAFTPGRALAPGSSVGMGPLFITYTLGVVWPESVFLGGLGVVGPPPSFVPYPLTLHRSKV